MEKELFGLRDRDGKEYKVTAIVMDNGRLILDYAIPIEPVKKVEPLPEFKADQWAAWEEDWDEDEDEHKKHIFYITAIDMKDKIVSGNSFEPVTKVEDKCTIRDLVSVTPQEIEAHLRKICDEKYIGKKAQCLFDNQYYTVEKYYKYVGIDSLWYIDDNNGAIKVYGQGQFAEVIPDKKKLPKTKEELNEFLRTYLLDEREDDEFLNDYED